METEAFGAIFGASLGGDGEPEMGRRRERKVAKSRGKVRRNGRRRELTLLGVVGNWSVRQIRCRPQGSPGVALLEMSLETRALFYSAKPL